ncbi:uncharacterized protein FOMMEDRAFT_151852 [Fomitiporia mediterranea MF3/22]|uniref:uncharacterized protein n=1 Tax=Fomitiporia mediterranea (strain MF3/22) TaxID=694068 RepID=UPI00044075FB|nr:uncharacterized protein FOMMEDRAFT_151852 [Fomitiporia mediterranea MF3/22]EJD06580.1 hypothetical protein FOMMEDRAFT_151852 [Fomitiporia mediterranea MF3/22]
MLVLSLRSCDDTTQLASPSFSVKLSNDFFSNSMHSCTPSRSATQATIGEYALATMSMSDHSSGAILSPAPRALSYPTHHPMFDITLDGPTPCAFIFPSTVHDTISNGSSDPPLPSQPSLLNQLVQHSGSQPACATHTRCTPSPHSLNLQNLLDLAIQLAGTERRLRHGDEDYFVQPKNALILYRREFCLQKNRAEAASDAGIGTVEII